MYGQSLPNNKTNSKKSEDNDKKKSLEWFIDRIGKEVYKSLKVFQGMEPKKIKILDQSHAKYLFYLQEKFNSDFFE